MEEFVMQMMHDETRSKLFYSKHPNIQSLSEFVRRMTRDVKNSTHDRVAIF
jgi:predicted adenine nucleotide alpha hydrolase (AANH) superfamily ATPase